MGGRRWRLNRSLGFLLAALGWLSLIVGATSPTATAAPKNAKRQLLVPLPASCTAAPSLLPVSPTPSWPSSAQILNAVEQAVSSQYPSVYGGMFYSQPPGQPVNSNLVIVETVHDPALEAEARAAYPPGLVVSFQVAQRSLQCLHDIQKQVTARRSAITRAGITMASNGQNDLLNQIAVGVTACSAPAERLAKSWFHQRWGNAVHVQTCQKAVQPFKASATAASRTGTLMGTAFPCTGVAASQTGPPKTWRVHVVLQRGTKVVGCRTVIDSWKPRHSTQLQPFTFRVPAGSYLVSAPPFHRTVVIEAGQTTKVTLPNVCG